MTRSARRRHVTAALPPEPRVILTRTDNVSGTPNAWRVECENPPHCTYETDLDMALLWVKTLAARIEREQVHR